MKQSVANVFTRYKKIMIILLIFSTGFTIYTFLQPAAITSQVNDNTSQVETGYDYQAEITPNILYPNGGTVDVGNTIFKKITSAIPFNLKSTILSERQVTVTGTHEVQLLIKAGEIWERVFLLGQKQAFEQSGTEISILDHTYKIDLDQIDSFIRQVEQETGIAPTQYTLEVLPNIQGTINDSGVEKNLQLQDKLIFQYSFEEISLVSETNFTTMISFTSSHIVSKSFTVFRQELPLVFVRIGSTIISILLLLTFLNTIKISKTNSIKTSPSEIERINKKFANRIIPVSQKINITQKSIFVLDSFKSIIKIADEKELPIFFNKDQEEEIAIYFIVDGEYLYSYETRKMTNVPDTEKITGSDKAYARG
ncbi:DUF5305 family protein [Neobacillus niacini]|uniref:DUF5305 family protein n=1 Tax=Neobacillus niacini TaxID=86668 RepID=UPI002FFE00F1